MLLLLNDDVQPYIYTYANDVLAGLLICFKYAAAMGNVQFVHKSASLIISVKLCS
jgi:hypothetical protein